MDYETIISIRSRLSFSEANILKTNLSKFRKKEFLLWMENLIQNTKDADLKEEAESLVEKIMPMTDEAFERLRADVNSNLVLFPPNYLLPNQ